MLDAVQLVLDVTENDVFPEDAVTGWSAGATDSVGAAPAWVTVTTTGVSPDTVTVTFATRAEVVALAE